MMATTYSEVKLHTEVVKSCASIRGQTSLFPGCSFMKFEQLWTNGPKLALNKESNTLGFRCACFSVL